MIKPSRVFTVVPTIPPALSALNDLAYNLRWTWDHQTAGLFRRLDPARWEATNHNPVLLLRSTDQVRLNEAARDPGYRQELLLGIGGLRALDVLGRRPEVCHLNEGHSAFLTLERIRQLMGEQDLTFD